jgi:hypothetical protein
LRWVLGVDLNHRPLGYEGNATSEAIPEQAIESNKTGRQRVS